MKKLIVEKEKIVNNVEVIKKMSDDKKIIAVIKCNGYGLGILEFATLLKENGIDFFAVSDFSDAILLRENGFVDETILLLSPTQNIDEVERLVDNNVTLTVGDEQAFRVLQEVSAKADKVSSCHIKIDTGFGRFGFNQNQKESLISLIEECTNIKVDGVFSHLSNSFGDEKYSRAQFKKYNEFIEFLEERKINVGIKHISNSSGFLNYPDMKLDAFRVGSALLGRIVGLNKYGLKKVGYLLSDVTSVKTVSAKEYIGYSNTYKTKKDTEIAIIPVGYSDGFGIRKDDDAFRTVDILRYIFRDIKRFVKDNSTYININGQKAKVLGKVCMYNIIVDISNVKTCIGDNVILDCNPILIDSGVEREWI